MRVIEKNTETQYEYDVISTTYACSNFTGIIVCVDVWRYYTWFIAQIKGIDEHRAGN